MLRACVCLQSHTILLVQPTKRPEGRTYADYESVNECMEGKPERSFLRRTPGESDRYPDLYFFLKFWSCWTSHGDLFVFSPGVCKMYEEHLKRMNPNSPSITYDISQLFDFIDDLADLSCLV